MKCLVGYLGNMEKSVRGREKGNCIELALTRMSATFVDILGFFTPLLISLIHIVVSTVQIAEKQLLPRLFCMVIHQVDSQVILEGI